MITVVTPVYNTSSVYLKDCIDSVKKYNLPHIIVDDCSNNFDTLDFLSGVNHIRLGENVGTAQAVMEALRNVKTEYVCKLDSDDYFISEPIVGIGADIYVNSFGGKVKLSFFEFLKRPYCALNGAVLKTDLALKYFDVDIRIMEDSVAYASMLRDRYTAKYHQLDNYYYRRHRDQKTRQDMKKRARDKNEAFKLIWR